MYTVYFYFVTININNYMKRSFPLLSTVARVLSKHKHRVCGERI